MARLTGKPGAAVRFAKKGRLVALHKNIDLWVDDEKYHHKKTTSSDGRTKIVETQRQCCPFYSLLFLCSFQWHWEKGTLKATLRQDQYKIQAATAMI